MDEEVLKPWAAREALRDAELREFLCALVERHRPDMQRITDKIKHESFQFSSLSNRLKNKEREGDTFNFVAEIMDVGRFLKASKKVEYMALAATWLPIVDEIHAWIEDYSRRNGIPANYDYEMWCEERAEANRRYTMDSKFSPIGIEHHNVKQLIKKYRERTQPGQTLS